MSDEAPRRVLLVRLSSIGDVVHTVPAYQALRRAWPATRFGWAVEPAAAPLVRRLPGPPDVHVLDVQGWRRHWYRPSTPPALRAGIRALRAPGYELAIDFQGLLKSALVARLSGATVLGLDAGDLREPLAVYLYDRTARARPRLHVIERGLDLVTEATGTPPASPEFPELAADGDRAAVDDRLRRAGLGDFVAVHAAANWPSKAWPDARWARLGCELQRRARLPVLWIWGPGEQPHAAALAAAAGAGNAASFPTTLPQLAALLARARLFVGGDSAPLHLAVAAGTPVVGVFGPTDPRRTGPLHADDRAVARHLPCSFCHRRRCPLGTRACLEDLPVEEVLRAALARLQPAA